MLNALIVRAMGLGLRVTYRDLGRRNGELTRNGLVILNPNRREWMQRCTLAHEMGHWWHGHDWTRDHDRPADERQADQYAAELLISPLEYALAESLHGPHPGAIAKELEVTRNLVTLWQETRASDLRRMPEAM